MSERLVENILTMYEDTSPDLHEAGAAWYPDANAWYAYQAKAFGVSLRVVAAVVSALSPRNRWKRNLSDAQQILGMAQKKRVDHFPKCATFSKNVEKAIKIIRLNQPELADSSPKTRAFLKCLENPECDEVVIDVWAQRVAEGDMSRKATFISEKNYKVYADAYREAAHRVDIPVASLQAIVWVTVRNMAKLRAWPGQMRLL